MEQPGMKPNTYNLDDVHMASNLMARPILSSDPRVNCSFRAIPLRHLGIRFRELSEYGVVIHESPDKLVIMIYHRRPELLLAVVRHAWVNKYMEMGAPCIMHFGPLTQYQSVVVTFERDGTGTGDTKQANPETQSQGPLQPQPQPQPCAYSNSTASSEATASPVNMTSRSPSLLCPIPEGRPPTSSNMHLMADFDFLGELQAQFTKHAAQFPEAYKKASRTYSGPRPYQPQPGALPLVYQNLPDGRSVRAPLPYQNSRRPPGYRGSQGNQHH
ncbi:uncharacterized protein F4817DRAFT_164480 [Daldinia loculata]|uniref:uncharacterized protein n=1 Tax=Daldinia loculata TaxID=103429 RepID=UPI0020C281F4|nr:uncharacterized protein F4817DRAFT_164480 [Daldinia loculata]KAI1645863.1 hypothetical protein F4817DRAFT_164480 [Daldinia loculata]